MQVSTWGVKLRQSTTAQAGVGGKIFTKTRWRKPFIASAVFFRVFTPGFVGLYTCILSNHKTSFMIAFTLRSFLTACLVFAAVAGSAQLDAVFYEVHYVDDGSLAAYPEGASTYRIYATMDSPEDALVAVYGGEATPMSNGAEGGIWNYGYGGIVGPDINAILFPFFPELAYNSMITIGRENNAAPGGVVTAIHATASVDFETAFHTSELDAFSPALEVQDGTGRRGELHHYASGLVRIGHRSIYLERTKQRTAGALGDPRATLEFIARYGFPNAVALCLGNRISFSPRRSYLKSVI